MNALENRQPQSRGGFVLILTLLIIMMASMVTASLLFLLRAEDTATYAGLQNDQAWATALSGVYHAMRIAAAAEPGSLEWQDNPGLFRDQLVSDDGARKWYFSVYSLENSSAGEVRYGLTDEAAKINVNQADAARLEALPLVTAPLAEAILDFVDADNTARPQGAEQSDYDQLLLPIVVPNRECACLDELLHVRGFNSQLLYGEDANLNGRLDPNEDDGDTSPPSDNQDGQLDLGLRQYLTVSSYEFNVDSAGRPRVNLNQADADLSGLGLPETVQDYLEVLRRNEQPITHPAQLLEATGKFKDDQGVEKTWASGVGKAELVVLLDRCTGTNQNRRVGLINLNTASAKVLATLPEVDEALAEAIVSARIGLSSEARRTPAWLFEEGLVTADQFKKIAPYLTMRSYQFHFNVVAYAVPSGHYRVVEAVVDTAVKPAAILLLRDVTRLGLPFSITPPEIPGSQGTALGPAGRAWPSISLGGNLGAKTLPLKIRS